MIVGLERADDAGVYRIAPDLAIVQTVDFVTPLVDDAADWGAIAAANALSDVYAMGGTPITALQLVGWPRDELPFELLEEVIAGAAAILEQAGCTVVGGHSIDDREPKFGLAVTGVVRPDAVVRNDGASPGDQLVLTKPLGTGIISSAIKAGAAPDDVVRAATASMRSLNDGAARAMIEVGVSAATDVTGFGLLGHLGEMLGESGGALVHPPDVPLLPEVRRLAAAGHVPGGSRRNLAHAATFTRFGAADDETKAILADAQTSGGLLMAVSPDRTPTLLDVLRREGESGSIIGVITDEAGIELR